MPDFAPLPLRRRPRPMWVVVLLALLVVAGALGLWARHKPQAPETPFLLLDGAHKTTSDWRGQVLLVNFWATSCAPCVAEMPMLASTYTQYRERGFATLAVAMSYDRADYVWHFAQSRQLPFEVAFDASGQASQAWGPVQLTPTSFLLDRQGRIIHRYIGQPEAAQLHRHIERLLAQTG